MTTSRRSLFAVRVASRRPTSAAMRPTTYEKKKPLTIIVAMAHNCRDGGDGGDGDVRATLLCFAIPSAKVYSGKDIGSTQRTFSASVVEEISP